MKKCSTGVFRETIAKDELKHRLKMAMDNVQREIDDINADEGAFDKLVAEFKSKPFFTKLVSKRPQSTLKQADAWVYRRPALKWTLQELKEIENTFKLGADSINLSVEMCDKIYRWG